MGTAETKEQLRGKTQKGDRADAGSGETQVIANTTDKAEGEINPSAPGETGTTPGTNEK